MQKRSLDMKNINNLRRNGIIFPHFRKNRNRAAREARARSQADSKKSSEEPDISAASSPLIANSNTDSHKP